MYPPVPGYDSSYISAAPQPYMGQYLNPNEAVYSAPEAATGSTDFEDEPPLLEGELEDKFHFEFSFYSVPNQFLFISNYN